MLKKSVQAPQLRPVVQTSLLLLAICISFVVINTGLGMLFKPSHNETVKPAKPEVNALTVGNVNHAVATKAYGTNLPPSQSIELIAAPDATESIAFYATNDRPLCASANGAKRNVAVRADADIAVDARGGVHIQGNIYLTGKVIRSNEKVHNHRSRSRSRDR